MDTSCRASAPVLVGQNLIYQIRDSREVLVPVYWWTQKSEFRSFGVRFLADSLGWVCRIVFDDNPKKKIMSDFAEARISNCSKVYLISTLTRRRRQRRRRDGGVACVAYCVRWMIAGHGFYYSSVRFLFLSMATSCSAWWCWSTRRDDTFMLFANSF